MRENFTIRPSGRQGYCLLAIYVVAVSATIVYLEASGLALLLALLGWREFGRLANEETMQLELAAGRAVTALRQGEQSYFYVKYKVYACRWFAILRLIDRHHDRTLILTPDCFPGDDDYRRFRLMLGISSDAD